jgi:transcriptional regulator with XRE-family HTH domain
MKKDLSTILKALIEEQHLSEAEFARRVGIAQPVINRIINGKTPNPQIDTLNKIADYFLISVSQLIGQQPLPVNRAKGSCQLSHQGWQLIPLITWQEAANLVKNPQLPATTEAILSDVASGDKVFVLRLSNTAMEPQFPAGALLVFELDRQPREADFVLVLYRNARIPVFKKLNHDGEQRFTHSINPVFKDFVVLHPKDKIIATLVQTRIDFM